MVDSFSLKKKKKEVDEFVKKWENKNVQNLKNNDMTWNFFGGGTLSPETAEQGGLIF